MFSKGWPLVLLCIALCGRRVCAQQESNLAHFLNAPAIFNPSLNGVDNALSATGIYRLQWVNFPGNPQTEWLSVQSPLSKHFGGGLQISNDQLGVLHNIQAGIAGSYYFMLPHGRFCVGLQAGLSQQSLDGSKLITPEGEYTGGQVSHNDPHVPAGLVYQFQPDAAVGISYGTKSLTLGLSVQHLIPSQNVSANYYQYVRTYNLNFQYRKPINKTWGWQLAGLGRYDGAKMQSDLVTMFVFRNVFWTGAGLRGYNASTLDAAMLYAGAQIVPHVIAGYAYEVGLSGLHTYHGGSHEIMLRYAILLFQPPKPGKVIFTPRF